MIGVSVVEDNYPLYCDTINEKDLGIAGLDFVGPCKYFSVDKSKNNMASFELIPYLLGSCETIDDVKKILANMNITNESFSDNLPAANLHWLMGDRSGKSIVVESTSTGLHIYDNSVNTLTNDPVFPTQVETLANFASVYPAQPKNTLVPNADINLYSRGLGTHHLPGGTDSNSRFIKVSFVLAHSPKGNDEVENVTNFFHILHSVEQAKGTDEVEDNVFEFTMYSDCMNLDKGILYFTTYDNNQINAVDMNNEDLDTSDLITYELFKDQAIKFEN